MSLRRRPDGRVLRIGHRGAAALEPENTFGSFERAIAIGVDFIEFDVLGLRDGRLVLAHDEPGAAAGVPGLAETLEFFREQSVGLQVDVKSQRHGGAVADALRRHGLVDRSVVSSFWPRTLREARAAEPELAVALTYPDDRYGLAHRRLLQPFVLPTVFVLGRTLPHRLPRWLDRLGAPVTMLHYAVVSRSVVERCHARDVAVWAWTVNDAALLERLVWLGVDGVISDDPRIFQG